MFDTALGTQGALAQFYIYNDAFERIGVLQNNNSVQWLENYQSPGEVKIVAQATQDNIAMLIEGNRIYNTDSDTSARICHREMSQTETEFIIMVRAQITSQLLYDRIVIATENIRNVEDGMYAVYRKNRRGLPIDIAEPAGYTQTTDTEISWIPVLEAEEKLAEISGLGFKVIFNPLTGKETFKVYKGVDRSKDTCPEYIGYFGTDVGNIQNVSVSSGSDGYKNVAIVAGEGEEKESAYIIRTVSLGNVSGENRREIYVDAHNLQREYQDATPTGEVDKKGNPVFSYETKKYTPAEYDALLEDKGLTKLAEHLKDFSITCDVTQNNIVFGKDYFLGDRLPVKLPEYGIYASAVISSANRIYEKEGNKIIALLDNFKLEA